MKVLYLLNKELYVTNIEKDWLENLKMEDEDIEDIEVCIKKKKKFNLSKKLKEIVDETHSVEEALKYFSDNYPELLLTKYKEFKSNLETYYKISQKKEIEVEISRELEKEKREKEKKEIAEVHYDRESFVYPQEKLNWIETEEKNEKKIEPETKLKNDLDDEFNEINFLKLKCELEIQKNELANLKIEFLKSEEQRKKVETYLVNLKSQLDSGIISTKTKQSSQLTFTYRDVFESSDFRSRSFYVTEPMCDMFTVLIRNEGFKQQECVVQAFYDFILKYISKDKIDEYLNQYSKKK
jgi:hypothetical protein